MSSKIKCGQTWRKKSAPDSTWHVVSNKPGQVTLTGPGPCRSVKTVPTDVMLSEWEQPPAFAAAFELSERLQKFDAFHAVGVGKGDDGSKIVYVYQKKKFPKGTVPETVEFDGQTFNVVVKTSGQVIPGA